MDETCGLLRFRFCGLKSVGTVAIDQSIARPGSAANAGVAWTTQTAATQAQSLQHGRQGIGVPLSELINDDEASQIICASMLRSLNQQWQVLGDLAVQTRLHLAGVLCKKC